MQFSRFNVANERQLLRAAKAFPDERESAGLAYDSHGAAVFVGSLDKVNWM